MLETIDPKDHVTFDPKNIEHLRAYWSIHYTGRQTSLRFHLEKPFLNVPAMMQHKIAQEFLKQNLTDFAYTFKY